MSEQVTRLGQFSRQPAVLSPSGEAQAVTSAPASPPTRAAVPPLVLTHPLPRPAAFAAGVPAERAMVLRGFGQ